MGLGRDRIEERMTGLCWYIHVWSNFKGRQFELGGFLCFFGKHSNVQGSRTIFFFRFSFMSRHSLGGALPRLISVRGSNFSNSNSKHHHRSNAPIAPRRNRLASETHVHNETHALSAVAMRPVPLSGHSSQHQRTKAAPP